MMFWSILGQTKFCENCLYLKVNMKLDHDSICLKNPVCMVHPSLFLQGGAVQEGFEAYQWYTCTDPFLPIPSTNKSNNDFIHETQATKQSHFLNNSWPQKFLPSCLSFPCFLQLPSEKIHSRKLTWNPKMEIWKMKFFFRGMIFRFDANFPGSTFKSVRDLVANSNLQPFYSFLPGTNSNVANYWDVPRTDVNGVFVYMVVEPQKKLEYVLG